MKVIIAILENLQGRVDNLLPYFIKMCVIELNERCPKNFKSMLLQTMCMCFWYNSELTFQVLAKPMDHFGLPKTLRHYTLSEV